MTYEVHLADSVREKLGKMVKEGKLDPQEKVLYKVMINDIKKNTNSMRIFFKKLMRWWVLHVF